MKYTMPTNLKYPRVWQNKKSKKKHRVLPWYEVPEPIMDSEQWADLTGMQAPPAKFGVIVQIGYLIENEHGIWIGMNASAQKSFKDLGEWEKKK